MLTEKTLHHHAGRRDVELLTTNRYSTQFDTTEAIVYVIRCEMHFKQETTYRGIDPRTTNLFRGFLQPQDHPSLT